MICAGEYPSPVDIHGSAAQGEQGEQPQSQQGQHLPCSKAALALEIGPSHTHDSGSSASAGFRGPKGPKSSDMCG